MNQARYTIKQHFKTIPFVEIILPYAESFIDKADLYLLPSIKDKLSFKLLEELNYTAEVTLQSELNKFLVNGNNNFEEFIEKMILSLAIDYPVLDKKLKIKTRDFLNHIQSIITRFHKDIKNIKHTFTVENIEIVDIDVCLGDRHNGEGTALINLFDGTELIYKPRNISITKSYNSFINWVNTKLEVELQTFCVLDCGDYGWLEFVKSDEISSEKELQEYYYKAGILLAIAYLLGSKDYHSENVISSAKGPILIDHETVIQPFLGESFANAWEKKFEITSFSVLESSLVADLNKNVPVHSIGYGVKGFPSAIEKNVPIHKGKYVFVDEYKEYFVEGFSKAYQMFFSLKKELKSVESPIALFSNIEVRFVWRPTFVYAKILKYLRNPCFMTSHETYHLKLRELLSKLYKKENMLPYAFILDHEIEQMLNGDIPIFNLKSHDDFLVGNKTLKIFEYSCLVNINHRINLLSEDHKNEQLEYINRWLNM